MIDITMSGPIPAGLTTRDLERAVRLTFVRAKKKPAGSVSLAFISGQRMRALNKRWRHKDRSTDVLSFSPGTFPGLPSARHWGDIVVDTAYVRGEARRRKIGVAEEVVRVTVHGMLHLFGYDHVTDAQELKMFTLQERVVAETLGAL